MSELKLCPFCGGEAVLHPTYDMDTGAVDGWFAWCDNDTCECKPETGQFFTEAEAAEAWNTRAERTCTNGVKPGRGVMPRLYCSNCGCYTTLNKPDNATSYSESFMDWPFYCGNCGAKVVQQ